MTCAHEHHEQVSAVADGMCPLCLRAEVARLHERLEDDHEFQLDEHGNTIRVEVEPGSIPDGIDCRDQTIKLQDEHLDRLRTENERLRNLVQTLIDNDPNDMAADAVTILDVWRQRASVVMGRSAAVRDPEEPK